MKKYTLLQIVIVAVVALIAGLLIGIAVRNITPSKEELAGSIGKVDRYRNVKVTDDDILLRNELVDDTVKCNQYEKYLTYYYYKSIRTSTDIEMVLQKTKTVENFYKSTEQYAKTLSNHKIYLENTRPDILIALNTIKSLNKDENVPVIGYLNMSQDAISRIRLQGDILMNYLNAINSFLAELPAGSNEELEDASDILTLNIMEQAIITQDKPTLKYYENQKLKNDKDGIKEFRNEEQFKSIISDQINNDVEKIGSGSVEKLGFIVLDVEKINAVLNVENLGNAVLNNDFILQAIANVEQLGVIINAETLGGIDVIASTEVLRSY